MAHLHVVLSCRDSVLTHLFIVYHLLDQIILCSLIKMESPFAFSANFTISRFLPKFFCQSFLLHGSLKVPGIETTLPICFLQLFPIVSTVTKHTKVICTINAISVFTDTVTLITVPKQLFIHFCFKCLQLNESVFSSLVNFETS